MTAPVAILVAALAALVLTGINLVLAWRLSARNREIANAPTRGSRT